MKLGKESIFQGDPLIKKLLRRRKVEEGAQLGAITGVFGVLDETSMIDQPTGDSGRW